MSLKNILQSKFVKNIGSLLLAVICFIAYSNYVSDELTPMTYDDMYAESSFDQPTVVLTDKDSNRSYVNIEIADTVYERAVGLMFREELAENSGMLFVFKDDSNVAFWMKNTIMPLDIIYISKDLEIGSISKKAQPCEIETCPSYSPDDLYRYVLEVNGGYTELHNIRVGDTVEIFQQ